MKLTQEELDRFPLQPGIRGGAYFEVHLVEDDKALRRILNDPRLIEQLTEELNKC